jgi:predicted ATPase
MLVAISGSQGAGKSTVINKLKEKGFKTVERKTSRSILEEWNVSLSDVNNNPELTLNFQKEIILRKYADEHAAQQHPADIIITERTYIDLATYSLVALGKDNHHSDWLNDYIASCAAYQQTYDLVFYLTSGHFSIEHDGVRGSNAYYSRMVDLAMLDMTQQNTLPNRLIIIDTPILEQRVATIANFIRSANQQSKEGIFKSE